MGLRALVAGAGIVAFTAAATSALGAGLKKESETVTIAPGGLGSATAKCEKGRKAVSGGFSSSIDQTSSTLAVFARASHKAGPRAWRARANAALTAGELTTHVYCGKKVDFGKLELRSATAEGLDPGEHGVATARCERGTRAISGGFAGEVSSTGNPSLHPTESRMVGSRRWRASGTNFSEGSGAPPGDLTAYVVCREGRALTERSTSVAAPYLDTTATAECGKRARALSGGFSVPLNPSSGVYADAIGSRKVGRRG